MAAASEREMLLPSTGTFQAVMVRRFFRDVTMTSPFTLSDLAALVAARAGASAEVSYTKALLAAGPARAARKFGEEAVEAVIAAVEGDTAALTAEAADVLFHLLVLLETRGVALADVMAELERRTARSGHAEKAARKA